jgi:hypothetical protein
LIINKSAAVHACNPLQHAIHQIQKAENLISFLLHKYINLSLNYPEEFREKAKKKENIIT